MLHGSIDGMSIVQSQHQVHLDPNEADAPPRRHEPNRYEANKTMAATNTITQTALNERAASTGIMGLFARLQEARARRAVYRQTVAELSSLSSRELDDLGIHRSMITRIASEAAWGK